MRIIRVIPIKKGVLKSNLTYFTSLEIPVWNIVSIPVRNKKALGLVVSSDELLAAKAGVKGMGFNLRKVTEDKGGSIFLKEFLDATFDTAKYFAQNRASVITALIPNIFLEEYGKISKAKTSTHAEKSLSGDGKNLRAEKFIFQSHLENRIPIYKTLIRESFAKGKSIFIVLPTELDIEFFASNLSKGIERFTYKVHSGLGPKKNLAVCEKILNSAHPVLIIGTPPYLSIPKKNIGTVVLEHESSSAYRTVGRPHFDLRIFAEIFASKINAKFIMADRLLRFETLARRDADGVSALYPPSFRIDFTGEIIVFGKKSAKKEREKFQVLKKESMEEIKSVIEDKGNVFIFSLRKGLATITLCRDCGSHIACGKCGAVLVLYTSRDGKKKMFACNKCGNEKDSDTVCDACGSWNLIPLGIGTDTVYEFIKENLPKIKVFKLDKESAKSKKGAQKIAEEFENSSGAVLIGTEMAPGYLKKRVSLSIIATFDSLWSIPSFRMGEKILRIMLSVMELTEHKFIIQARNERDRAILAVERENLMPYVREELEDRKALGYPPFKRFIKISYQGEKTETLKARETLKEIFKDYAPEIFGGFIQNVRERYSTNMLIKLEPKKWSLPTLSISGMIDENLFQKLSALPPSFQVLVDPEDLL